MSPAIHVLILLKKVYTVSVVPRYVLKFIGRAADDTWKYTIVALICGMAKIIVHLALIRMNNSLLTVLGLIKSRWTALLLTRP